MYMYEAIQVLSEHKAKLEKSVTLNNDTQLVIWQNSHDRVTFENTRHHTFSMYIDDGFESYHKRTDGWFNGGGPGRFCLLPKESISTWDIRGNLRFIHFYCADHHLLQLAESTWDKSPASLRLDEKVFVGDAQLKAIYQHFLMNTDWHDPASKMMQSAASTMVMLHMIQHYSQLAWKAPNIKGGLSPHVLNRIKDKITSSMSEDLSLSDLAQEAGLSDYHFARMFKQSIGLAPHQFVMQCRLNQAAQLLKHSALSIIDISISCGFNSASHFAQQFKAKYKLTPSQFRNS